MSDPFKGRFYPSLSAVPLDALREIVALNGATRTIHFHYEGGEKGGIPLSPPGRGGYIKWSYKKKGMILLGTTRPYVPAGQARSGYVELREIETEILRREIDGD